MENSRIGIIGSGSWATAIAKIITDNGHAITWWVRQQSNIDYFAKRHHNPHYLRNTYFNVSTIHHELTCQPVAIWQGGCLCYVMSVIVPSSQIGRHVRDFVAHYLLNFK